MAKTQKNIRLPEITHQTIKAIREQTGMNDAQVIIMAIDCLKQKLDAANRQQRQQAAAAGRGRDAAKDTYTMCQRVYLGD